MDTKSAIEASAGTFVVTTGIYDLIRNDGIYGRIVFLGIVVGCLWTLLYVGIRTLRDK